MPYMRLDTNVHLDAKTTQDLLKKASTKIATFLGKPESYVLIHIHAEQAMLFAGSSEPLAYIELKSIELPKAQTGSLSAVLCDFIAEELNIPAQRVYIEFTDISGSMWGWDGATF